MVSEGLEVSTWATAAELACGHPCSDCSVTSCAVELFAYCGWLFMQLLPA